MLLTISGIKVNFFTHGQFKSLSEDIYEQIQKWGVQKSDEYFKNNTTYNQPTEHTPGYNSKNAKQTNYSSGIYNLRRKSGEIIAKP